MLETVLTIGLLTYTWTLHTAATATLEALFVCPSSSLSLFFIGAACSLVPSAIHSPTPPHPFLIPSFCSPLYRPQVFMEVHARWAHKAWHDRPLGWAFHKSHHEPRLGPYELNDVFAIVNAPFAMALCAYGFLEPSLVGSLCFGAGLGITLFGLSYV